jgi:predicted ATP-grasp superfamily ATP-dependent carboligase
LVRQAGLRFPRTQRSIPTGDLAARWLVKRQHSSGGLGVRFATAADESKFSRGSYYQEYVEGQAASATFVAAQGRAIFLGGSLQLLGRDFGQPDRPFLYSGSIAPLRLTAGETASLQTIGSVLASQLGLTGLFGVDFVRSADVLWPIEVNPRYTASVEVLERATGASFLALHAAACTGGTIPERPPDDAGTFAGKQVVYASRDLIIPPVLDRLIADWNPAGQQPGIADLPKIGERIPAGQPIATVFGESASPEDVRITLQARLAKLFQVLSTEY